VIIDKIKSDMMSARKERNSVEVTMLSTLLAELVNIGKSNGDRQTTDDESISYMKKVSIRNKETIELMTDVIKSDKLKTENDYMDRFIPKLVPFDEIKKVVDSLVDDNDLTMKDMGMIMKSLKQTFHGNYEGKEASKYVKEKLAH